MRQWTRGGANANCQRHRSNSAPARPPRDIAFARRVADGRTMTIRSEFGHATSEHDVTSVDDGPANRDWIPSCWSDDAQAIPGAYRFSERARPWNWLEHQRCDAERL